MGESDPPGLQGSDTRRQAFRCLAGGDRTRRRADGHRALMAHPVDRRGRTLRLVFVCGGEGCRLAGEAEFEEIDPVAELDQALAEFGRRGLDRLCDEPYDVSHEAMQRLHVANAVTHFSIIEQAFV